MEPVKQTRWGMKAYCLYEVEGPDFERRPKAVSEDYTLLFVCMQQPIQCPGKVEQITGKICRFEYH